MSDETQEAELKVKIKRWLLESEWGIEELPCPPHVLWAFKGSPTGGLMVGFYQHQGEPDCLVIQSDAPISSQQRTKYDRMRGSRQDFIRELHTMLFKHHVEFRWEADDYKVVVIERIFSDGLTKDSFWRRLRTLRMVTLDTLAFFEQRFGSDSSGPPSIN